MVSAQRKSRSWIMEKPREHAGRSEVWSQVMKREDQISGAARHLFNTGTWLSTVRFRYD